MLLRFWRVFAFLFIRTFHNNLAIGSSDSSTNGDAYVESGSVGDASFHADSTSNQFTFSGTVDDKASSTQAGVETKLSDIVVVVRSQKNSFHLQLAKEQDELWQQQFKFLQGKPARLLRLHEEWAPQGAWTIFPLIHQLAAISAKWFLFCEDQTSVNFNGLLQILDRYSSKESLLLGRGLRDSQSTIIHHYAFWDDPAKGLSYPDFAAGWLMSQALIKRLANQIDSETLKTDFSIDVQHEIAMYVHNDGKGIRMTSLPQFCAGANDKDSKHCVTNFPSKLRDCGKVPVDRIFFAVKTTESYHGRLNVIKRTWKRDDLLITFFSNVTDPSIPTEDTGVPNVERGHCGKSYAILEKAGTEKKYTGAQWTLLVDDDTLISVGHLQRLLACYDPEEVVFLGEVYGYGQSNGFGYPYVTLGGGMAISRAGLREWKQVAKSCPCPSLDTPDDMWIGSCLNRQRIPLTHRPEFHQARMQDFSHQYLEHQTAVSFHRHRDVDFDRLYKNELSDV